MSKSRQKTSKKQKKSTGSSMYNIKSASFSAENIQHIIIDALVAAEDAKKQKEKEQKNEERKKLRQEMGYKDYSHKKGIKKKFFVFVNRIKMILKLFFAPKHIIKGDDATFGLLKISIELFFSAAYWATTLFAIFGFVYIPLQYIVETIVILPALTSMFLGILAFVSFLLSRMFRMASIEIDSIEDRNLLFGIFASIASIISIRPRRAAEARSTLWTAPISMKP